MSAPTEGRGHGPGAGLPIALVLTSLLLPLAPAGAAAPLRFLALGDSYTIGEGVAAAERWPERLLGLLAARGRSFEPPQIVARTGWTTDELRQAIAAAAPRGPYDLVSLMVGVNNQYRGRPAIAYEHEFGQLLALAIAFAGARPERVLVLSIPDYSVTPFARRERRSGPEVAADIAAFNALARSAAERAGARWVDVTPASARAAVAPELLTADGLHPSAALHAEWAELALPAALAALEPSPMPQTPPETR